MKSQEILDVLAEHHRADLYAEEVQCLGTHFIRLDAVALGRASSARLVGYEVKVSRADMRRDTKYLAYLDYVDHLYVVSPREVVTPLDIADHVGLMWVDDGKIEWVRRARRDLQISAVPSGKDGFLDSIQRNRGSWARRSTIGARKERSVAK